LTTLRRDTARAIFDVEDATCSSCCAPTALRRRWSTRHALQLIGSTRGVASPGKKSFLLRIDPALWAQIERLAAAELRSVDAQVEYLLRDALRSRVGPSPEKVDAKHR
jgi:hypothetical protein